MCHIGGIQHCCSIIRVYVADELCFHLELAVFLRPVLKCQIHRTRTEVTTTDTDLNNCCELFSCRIGDLAGMYLVGKISDSLLLLYIEVALIHTVCRHSITELSACHVMKHQTLLTSVDHLTIVKCLKLLRKLCFLSQLYKCCKHLIIHLLGCIVVRKSASHRHTVILHTVSTVLSGHCLDKIHAFHFGKLLKRSKGIQVVPGNHNRFLLSILAHILILLIVVIILLNDLKFK